MKINILKKGWLKMLFKKTRPVWAEINLDNLIYNIEQTRKIVRPETKIMPVVKADAYGHGVYEVAEVLLDNGADRLAVATLSEAIQLRKKFKKVPIMILGYTPDSSAEEVIINNIIQTIYSWEQASVFSLTAQKLEKQVTFHIKLDTGMSRLGFQPSDESVETIKRIYNLPNVNTEGIFTHFAVADEADKTFTTKQFEKFIDVCKKLDKEKINIPIKHVSNSSAIIDLPNMNLDMVRPGIMNLGLYPSPDVDKSRVDLKPVLSLKAQISHVKEVPKGVGISYALKYITKESSQIATLPIGYGDGFPRKLTDKGQVLVKGERVPVVGRICMDQCMIDVTGIDVGQGDEVVLIGTDGIDEITVDEVAKKVETINYEILCMISKRVPRVYIKNNQIIKIVDFLLDK